MFRCMQDDSRVVRTNGVVEYRNSIGQFHRVDGPAIECANGAGEYWVRGELIELCTGEAGEMSGTEVLVPNSTGRGYHTEIRAFAQNRWCEGCEEITGQTLLQLDCDAGLVISECPECNTFNV